MVLLVSRVAESDHRKGKQNEILHRLLVAQTDHTKELLDADFVLRTLQRHGIGPYLPLASERMAKDIESICQQFGLTEEQAIAWITNQVVEKQPTDGQ